MSADHDFTMTATALIKAAERYHACDTFHVRAGESRHRCSECGTGEADHILVALRTALANALPLPGDGDSDWDEEHKRRPAKLTSNERQQGLCDEGHEDWLADEVDEP